MDRMTLLSKARFGSEAAEREYAELPKYFVKTNVWKSLVSGKTEIVYGVRGAGKTALYQMLLQSRAKLERQGINILEAEGTAEFTEIARLLSAFPTTEQQFVIVWRIYFLALLGRLISKSGDLKKRKGAKQLLERLGKAGLQCGAGTSLHSILSSAWKVAQRINVEVGPQTARIGLSPAPKERRWIDLDILSLDDLYEMANKCLRAADQQAWIAIDRLDEALIHHRDIETIVIRSMFSVLFYLYGFSQISLRVFMRTDIWKRICRDEEFPQAYKLNIDVEEEIEWTPARLRNLIALRAIANPWICEFYGIREQEKSIIRRHAKEQKELLGKIFPASIEGENALDWIIAHTIDGTSQVAPRDVISLLNSCLRLDSNALDLGEDDRWDTDETLMSAAGLIESWPRISKRRYERYIAGSFPELNTKLLRLIGASPRLDLKELKHLWDVGQEKAMEIAFQLEDIGVFLRVIEAGGDIYSVPYIYQPALRMVTRDRTLVDQ